MKIRIILASVLLLHSIDCIAMQVSYSYKELNQYTLNMINVITDYQKGLSEKEVISGLKYKSSTIKQDAKSLYNFLNEKGIEEAYFKVFSDYILFVGQHLDPVNKNQSHEGKCGWALICRFGTTKMIKDGLTLEQIKSMSYPELESEIDSLYFIAKNASIRRVLDITGQSFSNCVLSS